MCFGVCVACACKIFCFSKGSIHEMNFLKFPCSYPITKRRVFICLCVFVCVLPRLIPTVAIGLSCGSPDNGPKMSALPRSSRILLCLEEESGERDFVRLLRDSLLLCAKETSGECDFIGLLLESCLQERERVGEERSACVCLHGWMWPYISIMLRRRSFLVLFFCRNSTKHPFLLAYVHL